jgi:acetate kinase
MKTYDQNILTINGGSSSLKFAVYKKGRPPKRWLSGQIDRIGLSHTIFTFNNLVRHEERSRGVEAANHSSAVDFLIDWFGETMDTGSVIAVGHRIVHGMSHTKPELVTQGLLDELYSISHFDPDHLPAELELIKAFQRRYPGLPQVVCFDTAFHHTMPRVSQLLPIPRRFDAMGIRRYGFHGLSYSFLMKELVKLDGTRSVKGRVVLAHLGNGASLAAVRDNRSIDTTMGFTPAGGIPMGTRPGDLDPGVAWFMMQNENLSPAQFNELINYRSGLLGVSETSSDMRDLLNHEAEDIRAKEAIELFCYQVKKCIGAFTAALGGLDVMVFTGGIGENAPTIRARICDGLGFLGLEIDPERNSTNAGVISTATSIVHVRVIHTDEEWMIANAVCQVLNLVNSRGGTCS